MIKNHDIQCTLAASHIYLSLMRIQEHYIHSIHWNTDKDAFNLFLMHQL